MNLAQRTVSVVGTAASEMIIKAIEKIGYKARTLDDKSDRDVMDEKDRADAVYYKRLTRDMAVALSLGIPLMIYGLFIGEMTVSTNAERIVWGDCWISNFVRYGKLWPTFLRWWLEVGCIAYRQYGYPYCIGHRFCLVVFDGGSVFSAAAS